MTIYEMAIKTFTTIVELFEDQVDHLGERMDDLSERIRKLEHPEDEE